MPTPDQVRNAYAQARQELLDERHCDGHWIGQLSGSALSTATAISALSIVGRETSRQDEFEPLISVGMRWLDEQQNDDGGWGDTGRSYSNISTTMLVRAAHELSDNVRLATESVQRAEEYLQQQGGVAGIRKRYGKDKTFAIPILTNAALANQVPWEEVDALPFEMACVPQPFYRFLNLRVVSYAIPALVAIGQARFFQRPPRGPLRLLRRWSVGPSLRVLESMQPASGGFLEATPLTSFVVMSLASTGRAEHPVTRLGVQFLVDSARDDGSWPIDTNLATWNTTLAINALAGAGEHITELGCLDWLLRCQYQEIHPYTGADPGGWGWSDLSGAVPDADDTPGALLALASYAAQEDCPASDRQRIVTAAQAGVGWLLDLQNRDGGWPTFCRGWGKLPFDRSGADLTAHVLRALHAWRDSLSSLQTRIDRASGRGLKYLEASQQTDGSWHPLWFGNQDAEDETNPVYGTAKVLMAYRDLAKLETAAAQRGLEWLAGAANEDGGWGGGAAVERLSGGPGPSSVEETALAVEALLSAVPGSQLETTINKGLAWLTEAVGQNRHRECSPIGFYFAKLWYYERLYPLIFTVSALGRAVRQMPATASPDPTSLAQHPDK